MRIQYCSDLHLEFPQNTEWLAQNPLEPVGDILIVAGDTFPFGPNFKDHPFFKWAGEHFEKVYLIPGNHEYYRGFDVSSAALPLHESIYRNVHLVNNVKVSLQEVELLFSTLWSKIIQYPIQVKKGMMDFHIIRKNGKIIEIEDYNLLFEQSWHFLEQHIYQPTEKKRIVVTHHLPSDFCNAGEFIGSPLNEAFCVDLSYEIEKASVDYWIYGHSHRNKAPVLLGCTQLLTNQLGYVHLNEAKGFDRRKVIEI